jgi:ORF6N domain-containing protein
MPKKPLPPAAEPLVPVQFVERRIHLIRGHNVMLDRDLADLYGVKAIALRQQVKRNRERFPADFMFQLTAEEADLLVSQSVIPSRRSLGGFLPFVFSQEGVAMLSSVLQSERAVQVNIAIMRAFVQLREFAASHKDLAKKIDGLERNYSKHDEEIQLIFKAIKRLLEPPPKPKRPIGFKAGEWPRQPR